MLQSCAFTWRVFGCGLRITTASYHQQQTSTPIWNEAVNDQSHRHAKQILQSGLRILKYSEDTESLRNNIINREMDIDMDKLTSLYGEYKKVRYSIRNTREERNSNAKKTASSQDHTAKEVLISKGREIKEKLTRLEAEHLEIEKLMFPSLVQLPNITHPNVPLGKETEARMVRIHGDKPEFDFKIADHVEIGERLNLIDFKSAAVTSGRCFYFLKGMAARLELALVQYAMNKAIAKGFQPVMTPDIVTSDVVEGCGFQPKGENTHIYQLDPSLHGYKCLAGTAEIPLAGMFMDGVIPINELPIKLVAFGRCFRAEAGHGKANKGLYRVHQFSKVEMFGITANESNEKSEELLREIVKIQEEINTELGFHYKLLEMPSGDLGIPAYHKYDIEVWMPGLETYGEVTSASNCTDFQSRRLGIKYGPNRKFPHTVNGTACAIPRTIVALLENNQKKDGTISLPAVLQPYLGEIIIK